MAKRTQEQIRIDLGMQCPECYGVNIATAPRQPHERHEHQCNDCGCMWRVPAQAA